MVTSINAKGHLLTFDSPKVMGIINLTPDSFYTKGAHFSIDGALRIAEQMMQEGASILDLGGQSTRPGAEALSAEEELKRVVPAIEAIAKRLPEAIISVDTYQSAVAREAVCAGASIVNDISAGMMDEKMFQTISEMQVSYILMHMQGTPQNMQQNPQYKNIVVEVLDYLIQRIQLAKAAGIKDIIVDLGFGFGKTVAQNYQLLKSIREFEMLACPMLVGISRKSMIYKVLGIEPDDALNGTTSVHMIALQQGANILRVHDVKAAIEAIKIFEYAQLM
jgi:dihydropteroate synthase